MDDPRDALIERRADAPPGLFLARSGVWFHDGDRVGHKGLEALLHRAVARAPDGSLVVTTGFDRASFVAEDAPWHVRTIEGEELVFADGHREPCAGRTFWLDDEGRVRCASRAGPFWALLSRTATQLLLAHVEEGSGGEPLRVALAGGVCPLRLTSPRDWSAIPADADV